MRIILASKSPRRKELLDLLNLEYEIMVSDADETLDKNLSIVVCFWFFNFVSESGIAMPGSWVVYIISCMVSFV